MCYDCYEEAGKPFVINENVLKAVNSVKELYETEDCSTGGYAHVVTDDWNLDDIFIDLCILNAEKGEYHYISETGRKACLAALTDLKILSEDERYTVMAIVDGFTNYK